MNLKKGFRVYRIPCTRVGVYIECLWDSGYPKLHEIRLGALGLGPWAPEKGNLGTLKNTAESRA